ncbi:CPBP family intramembrane glutamic endopeptidase [Ekhidna sp.]
MKATNYKPFKDRKGMILSMILVVAMGTIGQVGFLVTMILMIVFYRIRKVTLVELGLNKPQSWIRSIGLGLALAMAIILVVKGIEYVFFESSLKPDVSRFYVIKENPLYLFLTLIFVWITAGFGEEVIWRGFMMKNMAILLGNNRNSWIISLIISSVLFGSIHMYQGLIGVVQTGLAGLFLGMIYMKNGKYNLWLNILTHGFINTISLIYIYFS